MYNDVIIMAGGSGTRLWPASNSRLPKQFLPLGDGSSFFGAALDRAFSIVGGPGTDGLVVVVAGADHAAHAVRAAEKLPAERKARVVVIPEPQARNTAPAIACAAAFIAKRFGASGPSRRALVLTSDHIIGPEAAFRADALASDAFAAQDALAVFGIPPTRPETGFGYIEVAGPLESAAAPGRAFAVEAFREKPDRANAERFAADGRHYWNSGMFGFRVGFMLDQLRAFVPDVVAPFEALPPPGGGAVETEAGVAVLARWEGLAAAYEATRAISIDYAVAEKCRSVVLVAASFDWKDIGSWDDYAEFRQDNDAAGQEKAPVFAVRSDNCWVDSDLPVALCGVSDLIVAVRSGTDGAPPTVLVCRRGESQGLKEIFEAVKASGRTDLL